MSSKQQKVALFFFKDSNFFLEVGTTSFFSNHFQAQKKALINRRDQTTENTADLMWQNSSKHEKCFPEHKDAQLIANIWISIAQMMQDIFPEFVVENQSEAFCYFLLK